MAYLPAVGRQLEAISKLVSLAVGAAYLSEVNTLNFGDCEVCLQCYSGNSLLLNKEMWNILNLF